MIFTYCYPHMILLCLGSGFMDLSAPESSSQQKQGSLHDIITARLAKRAKVMFSQAFVCPSPGRGGAGREVLQHQMPLDNTSLPPPPGHGPGTWSQHTPTPPPPDMDMGPGHNTPSPPRTWTWDLVTTPHSPLDYVQAGGMHPTGMHSCYLFKISRFELQSH